MSAAVLPGCEAGVDGHPVGRDPRTMTPADLRALGHQPVSPLKVIRARCLDCCVGQAPEVRRCTSVRCPSWPLRMGTSPWCASSVARQEAGRRLVAGMGRHGERPRCSRGSSNDLTAADTGDPAGAASALDAD